MRDSLPYDQWIEDAFRGVIQRALAYTAEHGLPGNHYFFISFATDVDGVELAAELRAQYPKEMSIVLQHQYLDLVVDDDAFAVTLKFRGKPHRLRVPLTALTSFGDPSVNFGMQLKVVGASAAGTEAEDPESDVLDAEDSEATGHDDTPTAPRQSSKAATGEIVALDNFRKK